MQITLYNILSIAYFLFVSDYTDYYSRHKYEHIG